MGVKVGAQGETILSAGNAMLLYWKSQTPWPSFRGFLYNWNLPLTGGFYGSCAALSRDLHIFAEFPAKDAELPRIYLSSRRQGIKSFRSILL